MLLNDVQNALLAVDENVYYGTGVSHPKDKPWDYIVFSRDVLKRNTNRSSFTDVINVSIIREEYIPEGVEEKVIEAMEALPGVKLMEGEHEYLYTVKPNTKLTVEIVALQFTHSRK